MNSIQRLDEQKKSPCAMRQLVRAVTRVHAFFESLKIGEAHSAGSLRGGVSRLAPTLLHRRALQHLVIEFWDWARKFISFIILHRSPATLCIYSPITRNYITINYFLPEPSLHQSHMPYGKIPSFSPTNDHSPRLRTSSPNARIGLQSRYSMV